MKAADLKVGDIMQLTSNAKNTAFAACMFTVTEPKSWGAQGFVQALGATRTEMGGRAYYRATWDEMEPTGGRAVLMPADEAEQ